MVKWLAKTVLFLIIPVFIWVLFKYLGGQIELIDFIKRIIALLVAAFVMYKISVSQF